MQEDGAGMLIGDEAPGGRVDVPRIRRPSKGEMLRSMNKDLLLGLLIPGPDKFEVRGWVRWLVGDPDKHVPHDPEEQRRFQAIMQADDALMARIRDAAATALDGPTDGDPAFCRGVAAHDHLMAALLADEENLDAVRLAAFASDTQQLQQMLDIAPDDLENARFQKGFGWANTRLAQAVASVL